jgi:hypothetical protein
VAQTSYLISKQAMCAGVDSMEAKKIESLYEVAERAQTYEEYKNTKSKIDSYPALEKMGIKMRVRSENDWERPDLNGRYYFNPMPESMIQCKYQLHLMSFRIHSLSNFNTSGEKVSSI